MREPESLPVPVSRPSRGSPSLPPPLWIDPMAHDPYTGAVYPGSRGDGAGQPSADAAVIETAIQGRAFVD
jgi:hypothetical protein